MRVRYRSGGATGTVEDVKTAAELEAAFGLSGLPAGRFARVSWDHAQAQAATGPRVPEDSYTHFSLLEELP